MKEISPRRKRGDILFFLSPKNSENNKQEIIVDFIKKKWYTLSRAYHLRKDVSMKKIISVLLIIAMLLSLCACNKNKDESNNGTAAGKTTVAGEALFT